MTNYDIIEFLAEIQCSIENWNFEMTPQVNKEKKKIWVTFLCFIFLLTLKVPEKFQLYGLCVYYVVHICDFGMIRVKLKITEFYFQGILLMSEAICRRNLNMAIANVSYNL